MAYRNIYIPKTDEVGVFIKEIKFQWFPGLSISQKQKSIEALHKEALKQGWNPILEVSTKSPISLGRDLSAFNLKMKNITIENLFQGSKVFQNGGPFNDLYLKSPLEAKKDLRLKNSGDLKYFLWNKKQFPLIPKTFFYDWIYISALTNNKNLISPLMEYKGFSDIEFNPDKSINCQAYSVALCVSLINNSLLDEAMSNIENFKKITMDEYIRKDKKIPIQTSLF